MHRHRRMRGRTGRLGFRGRKVDVGDFEYGAGGGGELEDSQEKERAEQRELGARILTQVGFQDRQRAIVDSSFDKARKSGEKLVGKNAGRRNDAYIQRLEGLIDEHGNDFEKKLWDASIEKLIIQPEDIEESYWKSQEQILRDNGQGRELGEYEKELLVDDIQRQQRESLRDWADYLGNEETPYPMWFKVYAWDGMSKMGVFDKGKQEFKKRNEHTVAPYVHLNQAVLGKVYGAIDEFYYRNTEEGDEEKRDEVLDALVKSGSFSKLYTKFLLEQKVAPKTPERTEDVHGEWVEYLPGQEEELAVAAEGTPWCVASPVVGRRYLYDKTRRTNQDNWEDEGEYDEEEDDEYDDEEQWFDYEQVYDRETGKTFYYVHDLRYEYETEDGEWQKYTDRELKQRQELEKAEEEKKNRENPGKAKFILFHLRDPKTEMLAENACASIRLNGSGEVAEVSGLNEGQALEDSLVPIVEEKVRTLPGGEKFLEAFADKKRMIALDKKLQAGEELTDEDADFIWERERKIRRLDSYMMEDPRKQELKLHLINTGKFEDAEIKSFLEMSERDKLEEILPELVKAGIDGRKLVDLGYQYYQRGSVDKFANFLQFTNNSGIEDLDAVLAMWNGEFTVDEMEDLVQRGVDPDIFLKYKDEVKSDEIKDFLRVGVRPELVAEKSLRNRSWYTYQAEDRKLKETNSRVRDYELKNIRRNNKAMINSISQLLSGGASLWQIVNSESTRERKLELLTFIEENSRDIEEISGIEVDWRERREIEDRLKTELE